MIATILLVSRRAVAWLFVAFACIASLHAADRKPNFLFIFTDDQRWDAMGVVQREQGERARFPWFKSPNMDRLAAGGVRLRNAFVTLSLCAPSRAAFLTGRYNHLNGITDNGTPFPADAVTHASLLRAAGYRTSYIGKWHMGNQRGQRPGFDYSANWRQSFFAEYYRELGDVPTLFGVRTTTHKLVKYPGHPEWTEVFDLVADPYEIRNLAADSALTTKLEAELDALVKAVNYTVPLNADQQE